MHSVAVAEFASVCCKLASLSVNAVNAVQMCLLFEVCVSLRADVDSKSRTKLIETCRSSVIAQGEPPDDSEVMAPELFPQWEPCLGLPRVLHVAFPDAHVDANEFLYVSRIQL